MDKNIVGLLGGVSALALIGGAQAASAEPAAAPQPARSYAELLDPIPNAAERLNVDDAASVELAQYYYYGGPYHHHHHHHHHHRWYYGYVPHPYYHHHHHHHHHHFVIPLPGY
jgi:hypothetical protein